MKTYKNLFCRITSFENLLLASAKAQKGKKYKQNTAKFNINIEKELLKLQDEIISKCYRPGRYKEFIIYEPKKRMISAAPYRDRVVHHALCNVIEPVFEKIFIYDSYANRKNKGTHKAILRYQEYAKKNKYILKADIKKYFPCVDHSILKREIRKKIACRDTLWLIDLIIDNSNRQEDTHDIFEGDDLFTVIERRKGLPMGNLTSQFFANIYLNPLDHFIKEQLKCKYYIRYVDDFVIFDNGKRNLHKIKQNIRQFLNTYRLQLHQGKTKVFPVDTGIAFLGHKIFPDFRLLKKENLKRFRKRLRKQLKLMDRGILTEEELLLSLQSWNAHASFSNTFRLREKIFNNMPEHIRDKLNIDVLRGGSWNNNNNNIRAANRNRNNPENRNNNIGFRIVST